MYYLALFSNEMKEKLRIIKFDRSNNIIFQKNTITHHVILSLFSMDIKIHSLFKQRNEDEKSDIVLLISE